MVLFCQLSLFRLLQEGKQCNTYFFLLTLELLVFTYYVSCNCNAMSSWVDIFFYLTIPLISSFDSHNNVLSDMSGYNFREIQWADR
jgi:hypothetical protein